MNIKNEKSIYSFLSRYIDGELSQEEAAFVEKKLETDQKAKKMVEDNRIMSEHLSEVFSNAKNQYPIQSRLSKFVDNLRNVPQGRSRFSLFKQRVWPPSKQSIVAVTLLVLFIGIMGAVTIPNFMNAQLRHYRISNAIGSKGYTPQLETGASFFGTGQTPQASQSYGMGMAGGVYLGESLQGLGYISAADGSVTQNQAQETITDQRKVIRDAQMSIQVENVTESREKVKDIVEQHKGLIANATLNEETSIPWTRLTLWIPAEELDVILEQLSELGRTQNLEIQTQDITEQYFDLETRVRNLKRQEERLLALYEREVEKLDELLKVEKEIQRVRTEIEQLQGRQRMWDRQISLSTIELTISQVPAQKPIAVSETEDVFSPMRRAFRDAKAVFLYSCSIISTIVSWIVSSIIFLAPWLFIVVVLWFIVKGLLWVRLSWK